MYVIKLYESLKNADMLGEKKELNIDILSDKENKCIIITDAGIEMTTNQIISNLDTIQDHE
jgi:HSP90 family molecular chaperone